MSTTTKKRAAGKIKSFVPDTLPTRPSGRSGRETAPNFAPPGYTIPAEPHRVWERDGFTLAMGAIPVREDDRPPEAILRGTCPDCAGDLVANLYCHEQRGYLLRYECWEGILPGGTCDFYTVP